MQNCDDIGGADFQSDRVFIAVRTTAEAIKVFGESVRESQDLKDIVEQINQAFTPPITAEELRAAFPKPTKTRRIRDSRPRPAPKSGGLR